MDGLVAAGAPWPGAVAVSGGGDSVALMHLLAGWARRARKPAPAVVTVDHGLHADSAGAARKVVQWAKRAGLKATALRWNGPRPTSDIEAEARQARYKLIGDWAKAKRIAAIYVAHTEDDQAETFLLRLMRGSGLDGLSAMRAIAPYPVPGHRALTVVRPLLTIERDAVREHLAANDLAWLDDPMNTQDRFARVRLRKLLPALEEAGLTRGRIAGAAFHLARAREALELVTGAVLSRVARPKDATLHVDLVGLAAAPREIGLRALAQLLMTVSGQPYRPRFERLERLFDRLRDGQMGGGGTLHGCRLSMAPAGKGTFGAETLVIAAETGRLGDKTSTRNRRS